MTSVNDIRRTFVDYFVARGHADVASGPLVPQNDPTLMFTNAGMVQFKNVFTGLEKRPYTTAVTSQKCVRAGGKHNDLDNVGMTARHLTFFEMLGNFSFGDYFKERAIELAWNLVTGDFGVAREKLLVTVYHEDDEAFELWRKIAGLGEDRIIRIATSDNFWSMGDTGPCGPCSEIFYDFGDKVWGGPPGSAEEDGDRFIEIWNLVFMQYDQQADGARVSLPKPSIDTGMGLERISALLQGTNNVFETDMFRNLVEAAASVTGSGGGEENLVSQRVIADHLRSMCFLIGEGVLPSNEGRGYVLRRIMRRAMRHASLLGSDEPAIFRMVPSLVQEMGQAYPELVHGQEMIGETIMLEEERFLKTLSRGMQILNQKTAGLGEGDVLDGETAFTLYDTYGFPLDLTEDALKERRIGVDHEGFDEAMEKQKSIARASWKGSGASADDMVWFGVSERAGPSEFLGYDHEEAQGQILALVRDGAEVEELGEGESGFVVCNQTPFYAESGGQVGDAGEMEGKDSLAFVSDVQKRAGDVFVHSVKVRSGRFCRGENVYLRVDRKRRTAIRANHSATHLLHAALRQVLGTHVVQKGSLVDGERLRFDFSHNKGLSKSEIEEIEALANRVVLQNSAVQTQLMGVEEARRAGAMALFGEKYGDEVRVVRMGHQPDDGDEENLQKPYSMELCGGTHVRRTGDIGLIRIVQESSVAAGVRRIEAVSAEGARRYLVAQDEALKLVAERVKSSPAEVEQRVLALLEERRKLERELEKTRRKVALGGSGKNSDGVETIAGMKFCGRVVEGLAPRDLRGIVDQTKKQLGSGIAVVIGITDDRKAGLAVGVTRDLAEKISAVDLVRAGAAILGGKGGGGRNDMAQAGGPDGSKADLAMEEIRQKIRG